MAFIIDMLLNFIGKSDVIPISNRTFVRSPSTKWLLQSERKVGADVNIFFLVVNPAGSTWSTTNLKFEEIEKRLLDKNNDPHTHGSKKSLISPSQKQHKTDGNLIPLTS